MTIVLKEVDAVCIGVGFTGSILARELTKAGLKVVGLERGAVGAAHGNPPAGLVNRRYRRAEMERGSVLAAFG